MKRLRRFGTRSEQRPRLALDRLDEELGSGRKKYTRTERLIAAEFRDAMNDDPGARRNSDAALMQAVRRYTDHQIAYLRQCKEPAKTLVIENRKPINVDEALIALRIARRNPLEEYWSADGERAEPLLNKWIVRKAQYRRDPTGSINGIEHFCWPEPKVRLAGREYDDD